MNEPISDDVIQFMIQDRDTEICKLEIMLVRQRNVIEKLSAELQQKNEQIQVLQNHIRKYNEEEEKCSPSQYMET